MSIDVLISLFLHIENATSLISYSIRTERIFEFVISEIDFSEFVATLGIARLAILTCAFLHRLLLMPQSHECLSLRQSRSPSRIRASEDHVLPWKIENDNLSMKVG